MKVPRNYFQNTLQQINLVKIKFDQHDQSDQHINSSKNSQNFVLQDSI